MTEFRRRYEDPLTPKQADFDRKAQQQQERRKRQRKLRASRVYNRRRKTA